MANEMWNKMLRNGLEIAIDPPGWLYDQIKDIIPGFDLLDKVMEMKKDRKQFLIDQVIDAANELWWYLFKRSSQCEDDPKPKDVN